MNFCTKSCTTYFIASLSFIIQGFKAVFLPLLIVEEGIYGAYMHQNRFKILNHLLIKPVFIVVQFVVRFFNEA